ncbi:unnamed protein product [Chilo suppressalis]|uniref:snRNA-activating protein complex subunit 4 n=1 Tax=Chilo suppressalis TaxID=168631 RepID=A0ABN8B5R1_CHISP|nr:unnamed protein product [Chilo suppressalis]
MDMDIEFESDEDTETQIKDLEHLTAVLEADEPSSSVVSQYSANTLSLLCPYDKIQDYSKIETALALNKLTDDKLIRLENILLDRLYECRKNLIELHDSDKFNDRPRGQAFRYTNCGKPYFKDKDGFQPPDNPDTMIMAKTEMYDFSNIAAVPGWTIKDKTEFVSVVLKMTKDIKTNELKSKIAEINRDKNLNEAKKSKLIAALNAEIQKIPKKNLKELALPIDQDYDWESIANSFNYRHSPREYSSLWQLFLHPSINKESWSKNEHLDLQKIANQHNLQNWKQIAIALNTGRTEYQCFVYFRTNMANTFTNQKWTKEEEEYLKRVIEYYRDDDYIPWGRVAAAMENRTKIQIYNKYLRLLEQRKGRFLPEEDAVILNCVEKYGQNFKKIKNFLVGRSTAQLRIRYQVLIRKRLSTVWTLTEDQKLLQLMANQDSSTSFASISKYFSGKDRTHVRARYLTLKKWIQRNPNVDIIHAPRRGARRLGHGEAANNLDKAVEQLKNRMQSEVESKKSKRITKDSSEKDIEESLIAFMVTEFVQESEKKPVVVYLPYENDNVMVASTSTLDSTNLQKTLVLLRANLNQQNFQKSSHSEKYPELKNSEGDACLIKVKSYSKKNSVNTIKINKCPDVWGNPISRPAEYVIPPNLSTITGCKTFITNLNNPTMATIDLDVSLNPLKTKNAILQAQLSLLLERIHMLFLWPMLLSNEMPKVNNTRNKPFKVMLPKIKYVYSQKNSLALEDNNNDGTEAAKTVKKP